MATEIATDAENERQAKDTEFSLECPQESSGKQKDDMPKPDREKTGDESIHSRSSDITIEPAVADAQYIQRSKSRSSFVSGGLSLTIPRSKRRGLLGRFTVIPEVNRPYDDYSRRTKWTISLLVALAAAAAPMGSSIIYRTYLAPDSLSY
jgi:hypothetical protein